MLKLFSQFWLILSLLVAPLPYVMADMAMAEQGQMKCENADQHMLQTKQSSDDTSALQKEKCECCEQCGTTCSSCIHFSLGLSALNPISSTPPYVSYTHNVIETIAGVNLFTEFRPPRKLHA